MTRNQERAKARDAIGKYTFEAIKKMVDALRFFSEEREPEMDKPIECNGYQLTSRDDAEQMIHEHPLSVLVRDGWRVPDGTNQDGPEEYEILLSIGGPATRIIGKLDEDCQPETAELQVEDWFVPWKEWRGKSWSEDVLLAYARCFWFGE
jgi:hypothetical protein